MDGLANKVQRLVHVAYHVVDIWIRVYRDVNLSIVVVMHLIRIQRWNVIHVCRLFNSCIAFLKNALNALFHRLKRVGDGLLAFGAQIRLLLIGDIFQLGGK